MTRTIPTVTLESSLHPLPYWTGQYKRFPAKHLRTSQSININIKPGHPAPLQMKTDFLFREPSQENSMINFGDTYHDSVLWQFKPKWSETEFYTDHSLKAIIRNCFACILGPIIVILLGCAKCFCLIKKDSYDNYVANILKWTGSTYTGCIPAMILSPCFRGHG